jgi:hypothetical protein
MRIYLDDDSVDSVLVSLLRKSGHDVALPSEFAQSGSVDPVHLRMAIRAGRALMTCNPRDIIRAYWWYAATMTRDAICLSAEP